MILAAHQPNFMPWLGFFNKLLKADLFIVVDHVQFERQSFQNRTQIKTGNGPAWVIVPVKQASRSERVVDKLLDNTGNNCHYWGHRIERSLTCAYQGAPYFREYAPAFFEVLRARWERLADINLKLIQLSCQALDIKTPILRSSDMNIVGNKSDMVLNLCKEVGADIYLSGTGASKEYLDIANFEKEGVRIRWQDFPHPHYPQKPASGKFLEKLCVFDLLVNCGPQSRAIIEAERAKDVHAP